MSNIVSPPTDEEHYALRKDAQEGVAGARAALQGDDQALREWRENNQDEREP